MLDIIKNRLAAITPGQWSVETDGDCWDDGMQCEEWPYQIVDDKGKAIVNLAEVRTSDADATFIANAPADVAWLISEIERLQAELKEAESDSCVAWQRVSDAERELGIVLPDERGAGDSWPRIGRALRGEQREGDLSYRAPQRR